jgi:hypothetical protein
MGGAVLTRRSIKITMRTNEAPRATQSDIHADVESAGDLEFGAWAWSVNPAGSCEDRTPPKRGNAPAGESTPIALWNVLGLSSEINSDGRVANEISGMDEAGLASGPSRIA